MSDVVRPEQVKRIQKYVDFMRNLNSDQINNIKIERSEFVISEVYVDVIKENKNFLICIDQKRYDDDQEKEIMDFYMKDHQRRVCFICVLIGKI